MPGLGDRSRISLFYCGFNNFFPHSSQVRGTCPLPHPRDLHSWPHLRGQFGEILWDNLNNASDIIIGFYFVGTSNNDAFTVLPRLGSRFCNTLGFSQPRLNQNPELIPGVGYGSRISLFLVWVLPFFSVEPIECGGMVYTQYNRFPWRP